MKVSHTVTSANGTPELEDPLADSWLATTAVKRELYVMVCSHRIPLRHSHEYGRWIIFETVVNSCAY